MSYSSTSFSFAPRGNFCVFVHVGGHCGGGVVVVAAAVVVLVATIISLFVVVVGAAAAANIAVSTFVDVNFVDGSRCHAVANSSCFPAVQ